MKRLSATVLLALSVAAPAQARDTVLHLDVREVVDDARHKNELDGSVSFQFRGEAVPDIAARIGEAKVSRKTNAVNKTDQQACRWVMLGALIALEKEAKANGADAVIDITSNYKNVTWASPTQYECHAGAIMAGVALKGTYAKLSGKRR